MTKTNKQKHRLVYKRLNFYVISFILEIFFMEHQGKPLFTREYTFIYTKIRVINKPEQLKLV